MRCLQVNFYQEILVGFLVLQTTRDTAAQIFYKVHSFAVSEIPCLCTHTYRVQTGCGITLLSVRLRKVRNLFVRCPLSPMLLVRKVIPAGRSTNLHSRTLVNQAKVPRPAADMRLPLNSSTGCECPLRPTSIYPTHMMHAQVVRPDLSGARDVPRTLSWKKTAPSICAHLMWYRLVQRTLKQPIVAPAQNTTVWSPANSQSNALDEFTKPAAKPHLTQPEKTRTNCTRCNHCQVQQNKSSFHS